APILDMPSFNSADQVTLSWTASDEPPVTNYRIFRATTATVQTSGTPYATVDTSSHSWSDTSTTDGTHYFYVVQAYFTGGRPEANTVKVTPNPPDAVTNLTATPDTGKITLSWDAVDSSATQLQIYRSDTAGQLGSMQAALPTNKLKFTDDGLND